MKWLVKSEPSVYSFSQLQKDGSTVWDGVRNYAARLHLRAMKKGDEVFYYHSMEELAIVGIAKVSKEAFQDPTTKEDWAAVELKPVKAFKNPVPLSVLKKENKLKDMKLIKIGRLSVSPVTDEEFEIIVTMSQTKQS